MKRALAAVLSLGLVLPGPSFASSAAKSIKVPAGLATPALNLSVAPQNLRFETPTLSANAASFVPGAVTITVPAASLAPKTVTAAPASVAVAASPVAQTAFSSVQQTVRAVEQAPELSGVVLETAYDGSLSAPRRDSAVAAQAGERSPPKGSGLSRATTKLKAHALKIASIAGLISLPALAGAQNAGGSYGPYGHYAASYLPSSGFLIALGVIGGLVGTIALWSWWSERRNTKRLLDAAERQTPTINDDDSHFERGEVIDVDPISGAPVRGPSKFSTAGSPAKAPAAKVKEPGKVYFDDVAGQDEAKLELEEVVDFLKNPEEYRKLNPKYRGPKGVLVFGPPGTGKTLLARAVANEAGVPFVHRAGSDFINTYVGTGANNIRAAFDEVRKQMKKGGAGILFIDEIEAIGGARTGNSDRSEETRTINALLKEMDGFEKDNIIVIAATNMPESLDPALVRGGRFGTKVPVGLPDVVGREAVLKVHTKEARLSEDVDLKALAKQTPGLAGADLEQIVMDATKLARRRKGASISHQDFIQAIDEFTVGKKRKLVMSESDKRTVAYHESGHAIMSHLLPDADPVRKVTIIPHGLNALGFMQAMPEEEKVLYSYEWLVDKIAVALGGRVAEKMMTGRIYSGAQNDLQQATRLAKHMVMQFGMSEEIGHVSYDVEGARPAVGGPMSEETRRKIDAEVKRIIQDALKRVEQVLGDNKPTLEAMAQELMEKETLRPEDMDRLMKDAKRVHPASN